MTRYISIGLGVVLFFIVLLRWMEGSLSYKDIDVGTVDRGTIEVTVSASGKVIPLTEEMMVSPISTRILEVYKNPGDYLQKGDVILKLEPTIPIGLRSLSKTGALIQNIVVCISAL